MLLAYKLPFNPAMILPRRVSRNRIYLCIGLSEGSVKGYLIMIKEFRVIRDANPAVLLDTGDEISGSGMTLNRLDT